MEGFPQRWFNQGGERRSNRTERISVGLFLLVILLGNLLSACLPQAGTGNQVIFTDSQHWSARLSLAGDTLPADLAVLKERLTAKGISLQSEAVPNLVDAGNIVALRLAGSGGLAEVRQLLYGELDAGFQPLGVSTELTLVGKVQAGEQVEIEIASNPSTGYLWEASSADLTVLSPAQPASTAQVSPWLGAAGTQVLSFRGLKNGIASLRLVYQRSWETTSPQYSLSLQAPDLADLSDLTDPHPVDTSPAWPDPGLKPASVSAEAASGPLPAVYDWRTKGGTPPVRDQGACGSCWAFSTVGVLESSILIQGGPLTDLSEEYLLSCNMDGWTCNGGQIAHSYHQSQRPPGELAAGAVLEKAFPYQGKAVSCQGPYQHDYRIQGWSYLNYMDRPDVNLIKQAILQHGPVASTVCVGPAFTRYQKGLFATDESSTCGYYVNHGIVLVGWDDTLGSHGAWILRNSWGAGWGEAGYMYIDRTVSNIGLFSTSVDYAASVPPAPGSLPIRSYLPIIGR